MSSSNLKPVVAKEYDEVIAAITRYPEGMRVGSPEGVATAFHKDAIMYGYIGGNLLGGSITNLYDYVKSFGAAPKIKTRIDVLAITPTTAVVRVEMEDDASNVDFTDFHTLLKVDGEWKVISKAFHAYDRPPAPSAEQ
ncbi:hypothetical protein B0O99DRAFT_736117 [Bisporella sp. PMI_857]|nr:hypothetical protein B0O99DRAFT_736117 [Bisporella sp. PMI_857]